jgi:hypothetical protein
MKGFRRFKWLDAAIRLHGHPVLIGEEVKRLYDGSYDEKSIYLVFLSLCWDESLQYKRPDILDSLHEHQYDRDRYVYHVY